MDTLTWDEKRKRMIEETPEQWCPKLKVLESGIKERGFTSLKEFITTSYSKGGLGVPINKAIQLIEFNPAYEHQAGIFKEKLGIADLAKGTDGVGSRGEQEQENRGKKSVLDKTENVKYTSTPSGKGGNSAQYRIAKLKRDHPEVAKQLEQGEFKSVSQAERAAGIGKELLTPVEKAIRVIHKLSDKDKATVLEELTRL